MGEFNRSLYVGLLFITATSTIQGEASSDLGSPVQFVTISNNSSVIFGDGIKSTHFPILEYSDGLYEPSQTTNFTVYTRTRKCQLSLIAGDKTDKMARIDAESIWQLNDTRVYIVWNVHEISKQPNQSEIAVDYITKIIPVNMKTCDIPNSVAIPWDSSNDKNFVKIIPYVDGFDIISSVNSQNYRTTCDVDGYPVKAPRPFAVDGVIYDVQPASRSNLFVINKVSSNGYKLMLTGGDGKVVKQLLEFEANGLISQFGSNYTVCWKNFNGNGTTTVDCVQFSANGEERYREGKVFFGNKMLLDVQSLRQGGFLLFTLNDDGNKLDVTVMRPDVAEMTSTLELRSAVQTGFKKVVEFDETSGDVTFAYLYYSNFQSRVVLRKYHLANWRN